MDVEYFKYNAYWTFKNIIWIVKISLVRTHIVYILLICIIHFNKFIILLIYDFDKAVSGPDVPPPEFIKIRII